MRCAVAIILCALCALAGCRADPPGEAVPSTPGLSDAQILAVLAQRTEHVQTLRASGTLRLESDAEGSVRLEVALLASGDDRLRLRAWKLGQPVFDLTRHGEDVWLWASDRVAVSDDTPPTAPLTADHIDTGWRLLTGRLFAQPPDQVISREPFVVAYRLGDDADGEPSATARLTIDRPTQTLSRCDIVDPGGIVRQTIKPQRYRLINGSPWATRVTSVSGDSSFDLTLDEVELNLDLPASVFTPPRNAQRQP